jgi:hypothetical protein
MSKINRNAPCPCGSGLKFKKCCLDKKGSDQTRSLVEQLRKAENELFNTLFKQAQEQLGPEGIAEAWQAFCQSEEAPLDPQTQPEANTSFLSWLLLHWQKNGQESLAVRHRRRMEHRLPIMHRRFLDEACRQPFSFFAVTDIKPGISVTLRDLFWTREFEVYEQKASNLLSRGNILYTQVLPVDDAAIFLGCAPFAIPDAYQVRLIEVRDAIEKNLGDIDRDTLFAMEDRLRTCYFEIRNEMQKMDEEQEQDAAQTSADTETEQAVGEATTQTETAEYATPPSNGESLTYSLDCNVTEAFEALRTLSWKLKDDELPEDTLLDKQGQPCRMVFPWLTKGNRKPSKTENPELGRIIIDGDTLTIEIAEPDQKDSMLRKLSRRLGKRATLLEPVA